MTVRDISVMFRKKMLKFDSVDSSVVQNMTVLLHYGGSSVKQQRSGVALVVRRWLLNVEVG